MFAYIFAPLPLEGCFPFVAFFFFSSFVYFFLFFLPAYFFVYFFAFEALGFLLFSFEIDLATLFFFEDS